MANLVTGHVGPLPALAHRLLQLYWPSRITQQASSGTSQARGERGGGTVQEEGSTSADCSTSFPACPSEPGSPWELGKKK